MQRSEVSILLEALKGSRWNLTRFHIPRPAGALFSCPGQPNCKFGPEKFRKAAIT
jgi:hypothetical protein